MTSRRRGLPLPHGQQQLPRTPRYTSATEGFSIPNESESRRGYRGRGRGARSRGRGRGRFTNYHGEMPRHEIDQHGPRHGKFRGGFEQSRTKRQRISVGNKDRSWNIRSLSVEELVPLSHLHPTDLVNRLSGDVNVKALQMTLQQSTKPAIMDTLVRILSNVAEVLQTEGENRQQTSQILAESFSGRCAGFHLQLKLYVDRLQSPAPKYVSPSFSIAEYTLQHKVVRLCKLFRTLLETLSASTWSCLPVDELLISVKTLSLQPDSGISSTLLQETQRIVELRDQMKQLQVQEKEVPKQEWDNSEYRKLQILPQWKEVCIRDRPCKLRPNIIRGPYNDWLHYYDIQFRLLREDFVAPLRRGVCDYLDGARGRKLQDVKLYHDVAVIEPLFTEAGICYSLHFDVSHLQHCDWEHSKRLLFGSLVLLCLLRDDFQRVSFFATISNRDPQMLKKGKLEVQFKESVRIFPYCGQPVRFTMIESVTYFEASRHILHSLQTAEVDTMPFTKYLIKNQCESVSPPQYLTIAGAMYSLNCLYGAEKPKGSRNLCFDVCDITQWPSAEEVELDQSQLEAIQMGLTQEIAVIQGPPGTGKTYIGQRIVEALLNNRQIWDPQKESTILVMCFTNHALDQFLEGILNQPSLRIANTSDSSQYVSCRALLTAKTKTKCKVVRVGGRSQSELIQQFNIRNVRRNVYLPDHIKRAVNELKHQIRCAHSKCKSQLSKYHAYHSHKSFPRLAELQEFMDVDHHYHLLHSAQTAEEKDRALEIWLGLDEVIEEVISEPSKNHTEYEDDDKEITNNTTATKSHDVIQQPEFHHTYSFPAPLLPENENEKAAWQLQLLKSRPSGENQHSTSESNSDSETEDTSTDSSGQEEKEELIDIQGVAALEEGARMMEDIEEYQKLDFSIEARMHDDKSFFSSPVHIPHHDFFANDAQRYATPKQLQIGRTIRAVQDAQQIRSWGLRLPEMTAEEAAEVDNIHKLSWEDRWRLYNRWFAKYLEGILAVKKTTFQRYEALCREYKEASQEADRYALETADIIGMTTTGAAKYQHVLHLVKPRIVIVEEAAEVLESHIVSALNAGTQHLILIGDHKQLRPKPNTYDLAKEFKLDISLFERLVRSNFPHATLQIQHRMRPEIAQLVHPHVYDTLFNHESVLKYGDVKGVCKNMFFIQHESPEKEDTHLISHSNPHEARYIVALCKYLLQQGYEPSQITVLVAYTGQLLNMRKHMPKKDFYGVRVCTVDNFQGEENDIILLSLVRSNSGGKVGFLKEDNRVCVALSRAKMGFYCIGNFKMLTKQAAIWGRIMSDMASKGYVGDALPIYCQNHHEAKFMAKLPQDFTKNAPNGGCMLDCEYRLHCGHVCTLKCHTSDPFHRDFICKKPCTRTCPEGHPCPKTCFKECGPCMKSVERLMPKCGHLQQMRCHEQPSNVSCKNACSKTCPSGHPCKFLCCKPCKPCRILVSKIIPGCSHEQMIPCHEDSELYDCEAKVEKTLPNCGHTVTLPCHVRPTQVICKMPCERKLPCGHSCPLRCWEECDKRQCTIKFTVKLDCDHEKKAICYLAQNPESLICEKLCERKLPCKHTCQNKCSEPCTTKCQVIVNKVWPCGHKLKRKCYQTQNPEEHPCHKQCEKLLPCGHQCPNKCGEPCTKKCEVTMNKIWPCGHELKCKCYQIQNPERYPCHKQCEKKLPCGHRCTNKCGEPCNKKCNVPMNKVWPCGHKLKRKCYQTQNPEKHPCHKQCGKQLPCGHQCTNTCGEECTKECNQITDKKYPCGHTNKAPCSSTPTEYSCQSQCNFTLKCGHGCEAKCSTCCKTRIHAPCRFGTNLTHFCGHTIPTDCLSLEYTHPGKMKCSASCTHSKCSHSCLTDCSPCKEPCAWSCPHYRCSKLCHEICDRPPCNERCQNFMSCGHQCFSVCGEKCLTLCPECQRDKFMKKLRCTKLFKPDELYIQLACGHILPVEYMDTYVHRKTTGDVLVGPIQCPDPKCQQPISSSSRYGNATKQSLQDICAVKNFLKAQEQQNLPMRETERLRVRLKEALGAHMEVQAKSMVPFRNLKVLKQNGWVVRDERLCRYKLYPRITESLLQLETLLSSPIVGVQRTYLIQLMISAVEALGVTHTHSLKTVSLQERGDDVESTDQQIQIFLNAINLLRENMKSRVSAQLLEDLQSEHYRLTLLVQYCLVKKTESKPVAFTKHFLKACESNHLTFKVTEDDYTTYSQLLQERFVKTHGSPLPFPLGSPHIPIPPILKGQWWKCLKAGHYYCTPPTRQQTQTHSCPQCDSETS